MARRRMPPKTKAEKERAARTKQRQQLKRRVVALERGVDKVLQDIRAFTDANPSMYPSFHRAVFENLNRSRFLLLDAVRRMPAG